MDINDIKNVQELRNALEKNDNVAIQIGFFGGRKFSIGGDSEHKYSMDQLVAKAYQLASNASSAASSHDLFLLEKDLKQLNQKGDDALHTEGHIKTAIMFLRRLFRDKQVKNRFASLDLQYGLAKNVEQAYLRRNKEKFLEVLENKGKINELKDAPPGFSRILDIYLTTNKPPSVPSNPTSEQLEDIWERILEDKPLDFSEQIQKFEGFLNKISSESEIDLTKVLHMPGMTISSLHRVNENLILINLKSLDIDARVEFSGRRTVIQIFIEYLLKNPSESNATIIKEWIDSKGGLILPYE